MAINNNAINFRTKFSKHIQTDIEHEVFVSAFEKFINLDEQTAIDILWRLTYNPYSEALWTIKLDPETIPSEMTAALRNELRYQYSQCHSNFLTVEVPEEYKEAYSLVSSNTDSITAYIVYKNCNSILYLDETSVQRILFLLSSDKENHYFGGLRSLDFNVGEAEYLKPYKAQIYTLFNVMYELHKSEGRYNSNHTPFQELGAMIQETGNDLPFTFGDEAVEATETTAMEEPLHEEISFQAEESVQKIDVFNAITAEKVLEHKDVFFAFAITRDMSCLVELSKLGFDLNQVVAKEKAISDFIQAAEALSV
ncbi:MAG: hypothetical protein IJE68_01910 [Clostridia bacterium]|nr:hypothetical protein [Clostridia bacterium]